MLSCFRNTFVWRQTHKWLFTSRMDGYYIYIYSTVYGLCSAIHNFLLSWQSKLSQTLYESTHTNQTYHGWSGCNCVYTYIYGFWARFLWRKNSDICCCIRSSHDRLGFNTEIQIVFGTVPDILYTGDNVELDRKRMPKPCGTVLLRKLLLNYVVGRKI